jgi:hypothetical protein
MVHVPHGRVCVSLPLFWVVPAAPCRMDSLPRTSHARTPARTQVGASSWSALRLMFVFAQGVLCAIILFFHSRREAR